VILDGSISNSLIFDMINHSYELVVNGLSKTQKEAIQSV
jgi:predicted DNA-binding protein (MmcQ/YjbR family)